MREYLGIIDADSILYKVAAMNEDNEEGEAIMALDSFIFSTIKVPTQCDKYIFCLSAGYSNRDVLATSKPYKGNRANSVCPTHYKALREYLENEYNALSISPYEADDLVVSLHDRYNVNSVLMGIDKDNLQSAGIHYNYDKQTYIYIDHNQADYNFCLQMLKGDSGDNVSGVPSVGDKTAIKILESSDKPFIEVVFDYYMSSHKTGETIKDKINYFKEQYGLLRMLKDIHYPYELHFIELPELEIDCANEFEIM